LLTYRNLPEKSIPTPNGFCAGKGEAAI
jgi:hypothetical protein